MRAALLLLGIAVVSGCLGTDHVFPDESGKVVKLHVNAYAKVGNDGVAEITGRDAQNQTRAFTGNVRMLLEEQHEPPEPPTYSTVTERMLTLAPDSFTNPGDFPLHVETIPKATFPEAGTYRLTLWATIEGRALPPEVALFYAEP
jgi:hypothetical protein